MLRAEVIKEVILEFQEGELPEVIPREIEVPLSSKKVVAITGPRRSGKTYFLYGLIKRLTKESIPIGQIVYINFEDPRVLPCDAMGLELILQSYRELYPELVKKTNYLFLDEIQNVKDWEIGVRRIHDTGNFRIFLTGSSSKLLSREIATQLRGRAISFEILPFSFRELLFARKIEIKEITFYSTQRWRIKKYLDEYLTHGGFPEVIFEENPSIKIKILKEYAETIFLKDLLERYRIKSQTLLRELIKFLATNTGTTFSLNSFYRWIKSTYPATKRTLLNYLSYLEDSGLFFFLRKFSYSLKEQTIRKCYLVDNGLRTAYGFRFSEERGKYLENTVFLKLQQKKRKNPLLEVFYWQDYKKREVDFVLKEGKEIKELIQVCASVDDFRTKEREIKGLCNAREELKCKNLLVITSDFENVEIYAGGKIVFKPLWKWLLEE